MRRPHTDRFAKTAVRILRLSAAPPPISCLHFSFAEPHSRSSGIAWRLLSCPSPTHAESRNRFWTLWPLLFPFRASRALTSNCLSCISLSSPLLASLNTSNHKSDLFVSAAILQGTSECHWSQRRNFRLAMDASARVASYLDPV